MAKQTVLLQTQQSEGKVVVRLGDASRYITGGEAISLDTVYRLLLQVLAERCQNRLYLASYGSLPVAMITNILAKGDYYSLIQVESGWEDRAREIYEAQFTAGE